MMKGYFYIDQGNGDYHVFECSTVSVNTEPSYFEYFDTTITAIPERSFVITCKPIRKSKTEQKFPRKKVRSKRRIIRSSIEYFLEKRRQDD